MTRILNEDLRDRTSRATDTTKFLTREVQKLQADNAALDGKNCSAQAVARQARLVRQAADQPTMLAQLKAELVQKGALYSERHPDDPVVEDADRSHGEGSRRRRHLPIRMLRHRPVSKRWWPSRKACRKISMWPRRSWRRLGLAKILRRTSNQKSSRSSNNRRSRKSRSSPIGRKSPHMAVAVGAYGGRGTWHLSSKLQTRESAEAAIFSQSSTAN